MNLITELYMKVNGLRMVLDLAEENKFGQMDQNTKAGGRMTWQMEKAD